MGMIQRDFRHHKDHVDSPEIETGPLQWEDGY